MNGLVNYPFRRPGGSDMLPESRARKEKPMRTTASPLLHHVHRVLHSPVAV